MEVGWRLDEKERWQGRRIHQAGADLHARDTCMSRSLLLSRRHLHELAACPLRSSGCCPSLPSLLPGLPPRAKERALKGAPAVVPLANGARQLDHPLHALHARLDLRIPRLHTGDNREGRTGGRSHNQAQAPCSGGWRSALKVGMQ